MGSITFGRNKTWTLAWLAPLTLSLAGCGGGEEVATRADAGEAVVLTPDLSGGTEATVAAAAREHGAPGEGEKVRYRITGYDRETARAVAEVLRESGFDDVEAE